MSTDPFILSLMRETGLSEAEVVHIIIDLTERGYFNVSPAGAGVGIGLGSKITDRLDES